MTAIAFIGLGVMGSPMAVHLARAGHDVTGYNRSLGKGAPLEAAGGRTVSSIAEAVDGADVVAVMVPDTPDVQQVLLDNGVFDNARPGTLVIDFSSIRPDITVELAAEARARGLRLIDAPVSGGQKGAEDATLSIMVGGEEVDFAAALPLLDTVGKTVVRVGANGAGQTVKAANQLIVAANIQALAEAVVFLDANGVDLGGAFDVLGGGLAGSAVLDQKRANMIDHDFTPGFRIDLHHKDMDIVTSAARAAGVVTPIGAVVAQMMASVRANGGGHLDHSALLLCVERLSGRCA
ncbi:MAG: 2-hydroxy-3-oxopropionate reductase [Mycobacterium sp.]